MNDATSTPRTADREATADEIATAEENAAEIDLERVGKHYQESMEVGANVEGEGEIVPSDSRERT
jgi:hypothetical protein